MSNPYEPPRNLELSAESDKTNGKAVASLVFGIISIVTRIIPLFGMPTTVPGLVLGIKGLGPRRRGTAIAGIVLSTIFLFVTVLNAMYGAYLGATGKHELVNRLRPRPEAAKAIPPDAQEKGR